MGAERSIEVVAILSLERNFLNSVERSAQAMSSPSRVLGTHSEARALWGGGMHTRRQRYEVPIRAMSKVQRSFHTAKSIPQSTREAPRPRGRVSRPRGSTLPGVPPRALDTGTRARAHGETCGRMASLARPGGSRAHESRWFVRGHAPHGCRPQPAAAASAPSGTPRPLAGPSS